MSLTAILFSCAFVQFFSSNGVPAGLEGSSAGPNGTIPKWHMHHITMGALENFDYNLATGMWHVCSRAFVY